MGSDISFMGGSLDAVSCGRVPGVSAGSAGLVTAGVWLPCRCNRFISAHLAPQQSFNSCATVCKAFRRGSFVSLLVLVTWCTNLFTPAISADCTWSSNLSFNIVHNFNRVLSAGSPALSRSNAAFIHFDIILKPPDFAK